MLKRALPLVAAIAIALSSEVWSENMFSGKAKSNSFWWPDQVDLSSLRDHDNKSNPYGDDFDQLKSQYKGDIQKIVLTGRNRKLN